jgi:hypothetical protein
MTDTPTAGQPHVCVYRRAVGMMLIGGNHLATHIDGNGPTWKATAHEGLEYYGAGLAYDAWCCWRAITQARRMIEAEEGPPTPPVSAVNAREGG